MRGLRGGGGSSYVAKERLSTISSLFFQEPITAEKRRDTQGIESHQLNCVMSCMSVDCGGGGES